MSIHNTARVRQAEIALRLTIETHHAKTAGSAHEVVSSSAFNEGLYVGRRYDADSAST